MSVTIVTHDTIRANLSDAVLRYRAWDNVTRIWDALPVVDSRNYSWDEMSAPWEIARRAGRTTSTEFRLDLSMLLGLPGGTVKFTHNGHTRWARTVGPDYRRVTQNSRS